MTTYTSTQPPYFEEASMSAYYPSGPMLGSGIYDEIVDLEGMYCGTCEDNGIPQGIIPEEVEVTRRGPRLFYTCPLCGTDQETTCD